MTENDGRSVTRRRLRPMLVLAGLIVLSGVSAVIGQRATVSPEQAAFAGQAPAPPAIVARVEQKELESKIISRGTVIAPDATDVDCTPTTPDAAGGAGDKPVFVRRPPPSGSTIAEGDLLAEVSGRPVLALAGPTPMYRTIVPSAEGTDVKQLQAALARLGFASTDRDGQFGTSTQAALTAWYLSRGFATSGPTREEAQALRSATDAYESAVQAHRQAQAQLDRASQGSNAGLDVSVERSAVADAVRAEASAGQDLEALRATTGVKVGYCEIVFVPQLPAIVQGGAVADPGSSSPSEQGQRSASAPSSSATAWLRLSQGPLVVQGTVSADDLTLLSVGMKARFGDGPTSGTGTVTAVAGPVGTGGRSIVITPDVPLTAAALGSSLKLVVPVKSTGGIVLAVPLSAVSAAPDGSARVTCVDGDHEREVAVRAGLSADGFVEVEPLIAGELRPDDQVLVGR